MGFDKVFADGKAETASLYFRAWNAEITVKDTLMVTRVNSFPKVLHEYFHFLVHLMRTDNDTAILRRVVDGVGKEVREYPGDLLTVYKELGYFFRILHFDMAIEALRLYTVSLDRLIHQINHPRDLRIPLHVADVH